MNLTLIAQAILINNNAKILLQESVAGSASSAQGKLMQLGKNLKQSGLNPSEEEVQAALLVQAIKANGDINKIDPEDIKAAEQEIQEARESITESGGAAAVAVEGIGAVLGNAALLHGIAHGIEKITGKRVDENKLKAKLMSWVGWVKKATGLPARAISMFFSWVVKKFGGGELAQKVAGVVGTLVAVIVLMGVGVYLFPATSSWIFIVLSITSLIGKSVEIITLIKELISIFRGHEDVIKSKNTTAIEQAVDSELNASSKTPEEPPK